MRSAVAGVVALLAVTAAAGQRPANAAPQSVVLVELFTSEGCSSCPPADGLLAKVNGLVTTANQLIVGISEHVTYWNQLGWADPFSQERFTDRQNAYSARFGLSDVYTPQMVVDGERQFVGSDESELRRVLRTEKPTPQVGVHVQSMTPTPDGLLVRYTLSGELPKGGVDVYAVIADDMQRSNVSRGENQGKTLAHVSVARSFLRAAKQIKEAGSWTVTVPDTETTVQPRHLIVFAQTSGYGRVLAAESHVLPPAKGSPTAGYVASR